MRISIPLGLVAALACSAKEPPAAAPPAIATASLSLDEFQRLRWLQGTWRGTGAATAPFYETYFFLDDSTIRVFAYPDSTLVQANDSSTIRWSGGEVRSNSGDAEWLATEFDSLHVLFEPVRGATNSFAWTPVTPNLWRASLQYRDRDGEEDGTVYQMERVGR